MFARDASSLAFEIKDGTKVFVEGKVTVYEASGKYQIIVSKMQPDGIGELYIAYEKLKKQLESEGLFKPEYKKKRTKSKSSGGDGAGNADAESDDAPPKDKEMTMEDFVSGFFKMAYEIRTASPLMLGEFVMRNKNDILRKKDALRKFLEMSLTKTLEKTWQ